MNSSVHIPMSVTSRYALLNAMIEELAGAFAQLGYPVNPSAPAAQALHLFFNFPQDARQLLTWSQPSKPGRSLIQFFVDHPFVLDERMMDEFVRVPSFRLVMPCADETSLLPLRFPSLKTVRVAHGIPESALCDASTLESSHHCSPQGSRDISVLVAGSIQNDDELAARSAHVTAEHRPLVAEVAQLMLDHPWLSFTQACDIARPGLAAPDQWRLLRVLWRATADRVNTTRRVRTVAALQGLDVTVFGPAAWTQHCTGTIRYAGELAYADVPKAMARSKVCIAWGPTQFTHSYSERQLLSMAAGSATLSDDRLLVRRELPVGVLRYDAASPQTARDLAQRLLADPGERIALARAARHEAQTKHLWTHRVPELLAIAAEAAGLPAQSRAA